MQFQNLSDGVKDGIVIFYLKNGKLHPALLDEDQATMLDVVIATPFVESKMRISRPVELNTIKSMVKGAK